ncbi:MAG: ZIP family metal transporter [Bacteroidetes bacterium]|nr:ZIP family metal transporter [Bacteroidota bacterium]
MTFTAIFWLIFSVILGGVFVALLNKHNASLIKLSLALSGGFLLSIAFIHFVPELYEHNEESIGIYILIGFLIQLILEYFSGGIEHGHIHHHSGHKLPFGMLISLSIHSFIEGIPLGSNELLIHEHGALSGNDSLLIGILFHQFPVAIALMTILINSNLSKMKAWMYLILFALMTPAGLFFGTFQDQSQFNFSIILAIVVGMFLHISTTIIFETSENHKFNLTKLIAILVGAGLAVFIH